MKLDDDLCPHYLNLDFSETFLSDSDTRISIGLPYPIHKPFRDKQIDPIHKYHEDLENYSRHLSELNVDFQPMKNYVLNQSFTESHVTVTKGLLNFCNRRKPDCPFDCDYNPYYSSGILEDFKLNNSHYLIRPDGKNYLRVTNLENPWKSHKLNLQSQSDITGLFLHEEPDIFLLVRQKKQINLFRINDISDVEILWSKGFKRDLIDSKFNKSHLGVVSASQKFQHYDIESHKKIYSDDLDYKTRRFEFIDGDNVALLEQKKLQIVDLRSRDCKSFEPELNHCNYLCSMKFCDNLVYLGTKHHLIRTDVRSFKNVEFCTHLMKHSPCYMDVVDNFLCLSSQSVDDRILFYGSPVSSLPIDIPSVCDSLTKCRLQKDILLKPEVRERLGKSLGGIKIIRDSSNDKCLYTVNSIGDVFAQKISDINLQTDEDSIEQFYRWANKLPEAPKPLHLTNVVNLSDARFALNKRAKRENLRKFNRNSNKAKDFLNYFNNIYNKNNMSELATNFASIWEEGEEEEEERDVNLVPEVAPLDKVSSWIQSSSYFFD